MSDERSSASSRLGCSSLSETDRRRTSLCYWCHEPLPPLPEDVTYVDEINHYIHEACRDERDDRNRRMQELRDDIAQGKIDSIPGIVRSATLARIKRIGFARRCLCLSEDPLQRERDISCERCDGSGTYDPLPQLLQLADDKDAEAWVTEELPRCAGPCDLWTDFPEQGWYYDALGYNRVGKGPVRGVTVYSPEQMLGGVVSWLEIADLFRPRVQSSLF